MSESQQPQDSHPTASQHQSDHVQVSSVVRVGVGLIAMVVLSMIGMVALFRGLEVTEQDALPEYAIRAGDTEPPPPRLDPAQSQQLRTLRQQHQRILSSYAWIDEQAGIARIPIERAMEQLADQLPARSDRE